MSCVLQYNKAGQIETVLDKFGNESEIFSKLSSIPNITAQEAVELTKATYSTKFRGENTTVEYQSDKGQITSNFEKAFKDSESEVKILFDRQPVANLDTSTNPSTKQGLVNSLLNRDLIEFETSYENGQKIFHPKGESDVRLEVSKMVGNEFIRANNLGKYTYSKKLNGDFTLEENTNFSDMTYDQIEKRFGRGVVIGRMASDFSMELQANHSGGPYVGETTNLNEQQIREQVTELLSNMGVELMSIENYKNKFKNRTGTDVSAQAFADLANSVIAFHGDTISLENLLEETYHFLLEAMDQNMVTEALTEIEQTDMYSEHSQAYREVYSQQQPDMTEAEIEDLVKREILAKELVRRVTEPSAEIQEESLETPSFIQSILNSIRDFIKGLTVNTKTGNKIEAITREVNKLMTNKDLQQGLDMDRVRQSRYLMYVLDNGTIQDRSLKSIVEDFKEWAERAKEAEKILKNNKTIGGTSKAKAIRRAQNQVMKSQDIATVGNAVLEIVTIAKSKIDFINDAISNARDTERVLNYEELQIIDQLTDLYRNTLISTQDKLKSHPVLKSVLDQVSDTLNKINAVEGAQKNYSSDTVRKLVIKLVDRSPKAQELANSENENAYEEFIQEMVKRVNYHSHDTASLYTYYGQITHARDPLLNLMGNVISDMVSKVDSEYVTSFKHFLENLNNTGGNIDKLRELLKNPGSNKEASVYDLDAFNEDVNIAQVEAHIHAIETAPEFEENGGKVLTAEEKEAIKKHYDRDPDFIILEDSLQLTLNSKREVEYSKKFDELMEGKINRPMVEEYYKQRQKTEDDLNLSYVTINYRRAESQERNEFVSRGRGEGGIYITERELLNNEQAFRTRRQRARSPFNEQGELKEGLDFLQEHEIAGRNAVKYGDSYLALSENRPVSDEAVIAYDLARIDFSYTQNTEENAKFRQDKISEKFTQMLDAMNNKAVKPTRKKLRDFINNNVVVSIDPEIWGSREGRKSNNTEAEAVIQTFGKVLSTEQENFINNFNSKRKLEAKRKVILDSYKDVRNLTNIKVSSMTSETVESLQKLSESIYTLHTEMKTFEPYKIRQEALERNEIGGLRESATQDWYKTLNDNGIPNTREGLPKIYEFARNHMSSYGRNNNILIEKLIKFSSGNAVTFTDKERTKINSLMGQETSVSNTSIFAITTAVIENSLQDYYKTRSPIGLQNLLSEMYDNNSNRDIVDIFEEIKNLENVSLSNHYSFYENSSVEFINPEFDTRRIGERYQPNLANERYQNKEFMAKTGAKYVPGQGIVTDPNNENQKMMDVYFEYKLANISLYDASSEMSIYDKINVRQTGYEAVTKVLGGKNIKNILKEGVNDFLRFRVDEIEIGNITTEGEVLQSKTQIRSFPKPFVRALEDSKTRTEDPIFALAVFAKAANTYRGRVDTYGDIMALKNTMVNRGAIEGKSAEATNTYKMAMNYIESNYFGINETSNKKYNLPGIGEVDIAKILSKLHAFVRWKNLSNNVIVPLTSYFTARIGLDIEYRTEQYIDRGSVKMARKTYNTNFIGATKEAFNIESKNKLNVLGEHLGLFDFSARFENSSKSKFARFMTKISFGLHTAANFEPLSIAMLSTLYGHRVYNGKLVDFNTYKQITKTSDKTAKAGWATLEDKSLYKYLNVENGKVSHNLKEYMEDMGLSDPIEAGQMLKSNIQAVQAKAKKLIERIDGTIKPEERTMLQRNFVGKFVMTHKAWMSIALANKFKHKQFNFQTMQYEEGVYVTGLSQLVNAFKGLRGEGAGFNKFWADLTGKNQEDYIKYNMKRFGIELGVASSLMLLAMFMSGYADDDDQADNYMAQFSSYMLSRMNNEQVSQQLGILGEVGNTIKEPIVGISQIGDIFNVSKLFSSEVATRGRYKGVPDYQAWFIKNLAPLKQFDQIRSADRLKFQRDSYEHFNGKESPWQPMSWVIGQDDVDSFFN